jgi:hypothetical protein
MAEKRRIKVDRAAKREEPVYYAQDDLPEKYQEMSWRLWLTKVYARVFFIVLCLWINAMIWLSIQYDLHSSWELATLFAIAAVVPEYYVFKRLWGRKGAVHK